MIATIEPSSNGTHAEAPAVPSFVQTTAPRLPNRVIIHGGPGLGKTSIGAQCPSPVFMLTESGLWTLMNSGRLPQGIAHFPNIMASWNDVELALAQLTTGQHPFRTLVIDTLNGIERLLFEQVCRERFNGDWSESGWTGYDRGPRVAVPLLLEFLQRLDMLRNRGMAIMLLCHTNIVTFRNPEGADFDRYVPALHQKTTWAECDRWADMVLFLARETPIVSGRKNQKGKATGGEVRVLHTERSVCFDAKNRHGLAPVIRCGSDPASAWTNFTDQLRRQPR